MLKLIICAVVGMFVVSPVCAAEKPTRFWNLTAKTVTHLFLSEPGKAAWGEDLTKSDADGTVDHDERLNLPGIGSGIFDVRIGDISGRTCIVRNVHITQSKVFAIEEKQMSECNQ